MTARSPILPPREAADRLIAQIAKPARLLVAISGGSDSTGLLIALSKSNPPGSGVSLIAATVDHALRAESASEALAVAALCTRLDIPHVIRRWEGEKPKAGISSASRDARYRLLMDIADDTRATAIVTGHTLDDQLETVTMRAARSDSDDNAGLAGMAGEVLLDRRLWLLRPFLHTRRDDIRDFLKTEGHGWIDDPSNLDLHYERVRVRLAGDGAFDTSALERAALRRATLSEEASRLVHDNLTVRHSVLAHVAPEGLRGEAAVRRYALSLLAAVLGGRAHALGRDSMERVLAFLDLGQPGRITAGRVIFDLRRDGLYLVRENRGILPLHIGPGEVGDWDGRYRITNGTVAGIVVGPTVPDRSKAIALFPDVPRAIAMRAMNAMPHVEAVASSQTPRDPAHAMQISATTSKTASFNGLHIESLLAPFDRFLPQFDLDLGTEFAVLFGCDTFPRPPIKDSERKR